MLLLLLLLHKPLWVIPFPAVLSCLIDLGEHSKVLSVLAGAWNILFSCNRLWAGVSSTQSPVPARLSAYSYTWQMLVEFRAFPRRQILL